MYGYNKLHLLLIIFSFLMISCVNFSKWAWDDSAGMNGSFEIVKDGLPVNWLVYSPETIPTGDYDLIIDTTYFKDGLQSLKFVVRECSKDGGWHSPGLTNQYYTNPGEKYKVTFWVKNAGSRFSVIIGGVKPKEGKYETIVNSEGNFDNWKLFEYYYTMPNIEGWDNIRIELNILKPGTFWIDNFKIEDKNGKLLNPVPN